MARGEKQRGYIYFLLAEKINVVKIGFTRHEVNRRMQDYNCYSPYNYDLLKVIEGSMLEETQLHRRFVKYKIRNEWFEYIVELKEFIDSI